MRHSWPSLNSLGRHPPRAIDRARLQPLEVTFQFRQLAYTAKYSVRHTTGPRTTKSGSSCPSARTGHNGGLQPSVAAAATIVLASSCVRPPRSIRKQDGAEASWLTSGPPDTAMVTREPVEPKAGVFARAVKATSSVRLRASTVPTRFYRPAGFTLSIAATSASASWPSGGRLPHCLHAHYRQYRAHNRRHHLHPDSLNACSS